MGMVFTDHVADHAGRLLVGLVEIIAQHAHCEKHAPVDGLEAVSHVRKGPAHDHAHRVIEVGPLHLVFQVDLEDLSCDFSHGLDGI